MKTRTDDGLREFRRAHFAQEPPISRRPEVGRPPVHPHSGLFTRPVGLLGGATLPILSPHSYAKSKSQPSVEFVITVRNAPELDEVYRRCEVQSWRKRHVPPNPDTPGGARPLTFLKGASRAGRQRECQRVAKSGSEEGPTPDYVELTVDLVDERFGLCQYETAIRVAPTPAFSHGPRAHRDANVGTSG